MLITNYDARNADSWKLECRLRLRVIMFLDHPSLFLFIAFNRTIKSLADASV